MKAWDYDGAIRARRRESQARTVFADSLQRFLVSFRRKFRQVLLADRLAAKRRRLGWKRLSWRSLFTSQIRRRHRPLFHRKERLASEPGEQKDEARLRNLCNGIYLPPIVPHGHEVRVNRQIVIP